AEDGIRDRNVTGVQTCALPICLYVLVTPHEERGHHAVHFTIRHAGVDISHARAGNLRQLEDAAEGYRLIFHGIDHLLLTPDTAEVPFSVMTEPGIGKEVTAVQALWSLLQFSIDFCRHIFFDIYRYAVFVDDIHYGFKGGIINNCIFFDIDAEVLA